MNNMVAASVRPRSSNNIREIQLIHPQTGGKETKKRTVLQCCINGNNKKKSHGFARMVIYANPDFIKGRCYSDL